MEETLDNTLSDNTLIEIRDMKKIYNPGENEVHALDGVDLTICERELRPQNGGRRWLRRSARCHRDNRFPGSGDGGSSSRPR